MDTILQESLREYSSKWVLLYSCFPMLYAHMMTYTRCASCNDLGSRDHEETRKTNTDKATLSLDIPVKELDANCPYCALLKSTIDHFAPNISPNLENTSLALDLTQDSPATIQIVGSNSNGDVETVAMFHLGLADEGCIFIELLLV